LAGIQAGSFEEDLEELRKIGSIAGIIGCALERDDFSSNRHPALAFCLSMIFSESRIPLFRIML
jgi:hypothetical protein